MPDDEANSMHPGPSVGIPPPCTVCGGRWANPQWRPLGDGVACDHCFNAFRLRRIVAYLLDAWAWGLFWLVVGAEFSRWFLGQPNLDWGAYTGTSCIAPLAFGFLPGIFADWGAASPQLLVIYLLANVSFLLKDAVGWQSFGKPVMGLRVVDRMTGQPIGLEASIRRNLVLWIPLYIGHVAILATMGRRCRFGEESAGSTVIWLKYKDSPNFSGERFRCRACGYDLTGNVSGRCPECGTAIQPSNSS